MPLFPLLLSTTSTVVTPWATWWGDAALLLIGAVFVSFPPTISWIVLQFPLRC
jgi:hypothetical protein